MTMTIEQTAQVCHEANRALQIAQGDPDPSPHWENAPDWQKDSAIEGVTHALAGKGARELHEEWLAFKREGGWSYGVKKDALAKTHPCMVPYDRLPPEQKLKDHIFSVIVGVCALPLDAPRDASLPSA